MDQMVIIIKAVNKNFMPWENGYQTFLTILWVVNKGKKLVKIFWSQTHLQCQYALLSITIHVYFFLVCGVICNIVNMLESQD